MKCLIALLVALPSLAWAQTDTTPAGNATAPGSTAEVASPAAAPAARGVPLPACRPESGSRTLLQTLRRWRPRRRKASTNFCPQTTGSQCRSTVRTTCRPVALTSEVRLCDRWPGGMARLRVRGGKEEGVTDYGSAVCVGFGRTPGEWTFLSCSHNFESGGEPELQLAGQWVPATLLYRDKLAEAVETAPGQYTRVEAGPDRSVLVVNWAGRLRYRPVSLERYLGDVVLSGYPSCPRPVTISGQTESHPDIMRAALERPSQGGFSGGGVFNAHEQLVGIWTSGAEGTGYGHYVFDFLPIFRELGWAPGNWRLTEADLAQSE